MSETDNSMAYILREKCGCLMAAISDNPSREGNSEHVVEVLREWSDYVAKDGCTIERVTPQYVRDNFVAKCVHQPTQLELFNGVTK
jgi:hypothetical protein